MAIDEKAPSELRPITFHLAPQIPSGASIVGTVQAYASRIALGFTTSLVGAHVAEAGTVTLTLDVKAGALLTIAPGSPTDEEKVKVISTAGNVATLSHTLELPHSGGTQVNYEPGCNARMLTTSTPSNIGSDVTLWVQNGADGQSYRLSILAPLTGGLVAEEERTLVVTEHMPLKTETIQVDVIQDLEFGFDGPVALAGRDLTSAIAWASREVSVNNTIASAVTAENSTVSLGLNPGVGALLIIDFGLGTQEKLKVTGISGTGPFICTVNPSAEFDHATGGITYEPGVSTRLLSGPPTIVGATKVRVRKQKGMAAQIYRLTVLATLLTTLERVQGSCHIAVVEE